MTSLIEKFIDQASYIAIFLLMLLENVFPPLPSEIILSISGITAAQGEMNPFFAVLSATSGSLAGAWFWYWVGNKVGHDRLEKWVSRNGMWIGLSDESYQKALRFFDRHSTAAVFWGRMVPTFRTFISIPAGLVKMKLTKFLIYTFIGTLTWSSLVFFIAYYFGNKYQSAFDTVGKVFNIIFAGLLLFYVVKVIRSWVQKRRK
ncbi:DedA family protein [Dyadobacter chenhuakuii]|uniref:DedA family protein n=1 Tax=Dyadobacter chenhuakuii TaxID=2909339 RepID=A0A9X1QCP7_9BACT|nr:DedA family protein [Dyadobacter chenhuakuii]MCF2499010.1 DedA family protein [Dyadobacter chenhuakuii]